MLVSIVFLSMLVVHKFTFNKAIDTLSNRGDLSPNKACTTKYMEKRGNNVLSEKRHEK